MRCTGFYFTALGVLAARRAPERIEKEHTGTVDIPSKERGGSGGSGMTLM